MKELIAANGEKHGLINTVANSVADNGFKHINPKIKEECKRLKEDDAKLVNVRYINYRGEHERLTKPYCKWAGDPIQTWHFIPNHTYQVPKGLVKEVNGNPGLARRSDIVDANGVPSLKDGKHERIHEFVAAAIE